MINNERYRIAGIDGFLPLEVFDNVEEVVVEHWGSVMFEFEIRPSPQDFDTTATASI